LQAYEARRASGAGRLHRFGEVLSIVNVVRLRVARKSNQRYGFAYSEPVPVSG
jgi:hypothetical protein